MDVAGFVLAGGQSSRMGTDKALLDFAGEPLVVHALRILRQARLTASIAGARSPLQALAPVVSDSEPDRGPLSGICAALASTSATQALILSVDMPLLPQSLVALLLEEAQKGEPLVTVLSMNGFVQTFPVVIRREALPWMRTTLETGQGGCLAAFQSAAVSMGQSMKIVQVDQAVNEGKLSAIELPVEDWFLNVNEPADLARALACLPQPKD